LLLCTLKRRSGGGAFLAEQKRRPASWGKKRRVGEGGGRKCGCVGKRLGAAKTHALENKSLCRRPRMPAPGWPPSSFPDSSCPNLPQKCTFRFFGSFCHARVYARARVLQKGAKLLQKKHKSAQQGRKIESSVHRQRCRGGRVLCVAGVSQAHASLLFDVQRERRCGVKCVSSKKENGAGVALQAHARARISASCI
jgi:hypothetical protein